MTGRATVPAERGQNQGGVPGGNAFRFHMLPGPDFFKDKIKRRRRGSPRSKKTLQTQVLPASAYSGRLIIGALTVPLALIMKPIHLGAAPKGH
jgi:hypothetical protein